MPPPWGLPPYAERGTVRCALRASLERASLNALPNPGAEATEVRTDGVWCESIVPRSMRFGLERDLFGDGDDCGVSYSSYVGVKVTAGDAKKR